MLWMSLQKWQGDSSSRDKVAHGGTREDGSPCAIKSRDDETPCWIYSYTAGAKIIAMDQIEKKRRFRSVRIGTLIAIAVIMLAVIMVLFYAPPEGETNNVRGDFEMTPTLGITNLVEKVDINHTFQYKDVAITVSQAMIATKFSDDRNRAGKYTVRVMVKTQYKGQEILGVDYASLAHLVLPDGTVIGTKRVSVKPVEMPNQPQDGYFDFPVDTQVSLSTLSLRFDTSTTVPFGK
jgi:hypothetical protein